MTGFGRGEKIYDTRRYTVELKSVNNRYCDINIRMPRLFNFADSKVRKLISDELVRGKVDVFISYDDSMSAATEVVLNEGLVKAYASAVTRISEVTGIESDLSPSRLSNYPDVLTVKQNQLDEDALYAELESAIKDAINGMKEMRLTEGNNLSEDILGKVAELSRLRDEIAEHAPSVVADYRARLNARIEELLGDEKAAFYDEARLAAEVAVFADKCAIDEELKRLISHFKQAKDILSSKGSVGKKMDFLVQEINREINTCGSKANSLEITNRVLLMKNLVEEMREQIQNLV